VTEHHNSKTLMVQGTTSDASKSVLVVDLCRVLARYWCKAASFKPQKKLEQVVGMAALNTVVVCGYDMHWGFSAVAALDDCAVLFTGVL